MRGSRLSSAHVTKLAGELPARYITPLPHLGRVRVLTGVQLDRLLTGAEMTADTTARVRRRIMTRLGELGLVNTLQRRIGGVRAGSAGHVYTLTTAGYRLLALINEAQPPGRVRHSHAPGALFLAHALAISDIYVDLVHASRQRDFRVATFITEPHSWWPLGNGAFLRPDAYAVLEAPTHRDCWWLEIDQDTEALPRLRAKCRTYADFATYDSTGPDGVLPRVLFTAPNRQRTAAITAMIISMLPDSGGLIGAVEHGCAAKFMITELGTP